MKSEYLIVDITRRLPDINRANQMPDDLSEYGRFGITTSGSFFVLGIQSSHPSNTKTGGYYAVSKEGNILILSPRGVAADWEHFVTNRVIRRLCKELRLKRRFKHDRPM